MPRFTDWTTDIEAQTLAEKIVTKYDTIFESYDLSKVAFLRIRNKKSSVIARTQAFGFPADAFVSYVYAIQTYDTKWQEMSEQQKSVAIFKQLLTIQPDGFDSESGSYGKLRKRDVNEFTEVLALVNMQFDWEEPGVAVDDILDDEEESQ